MKSTLCPDFSKAPRLPAGCKHDGVLTRDLQYQCEEIIRKSQDLFKREMAFQILKGLKEFHYYLRKWPGRLEIAREIIMSKPFPKPLYDYVRRYQDDGMYQIVFI
jgi:hypothetical protein